MKKALLFLGSMIGAFLGAAILAYAATTFVVPQGGTGWGNLQSGTVLLGNGTGKIATTTAATPGQILAFLSGVWKPAATTTFSCSSGISCSFSAGAESFTNSGVTSIVAGSGISISGATGAVTVTNSSGGFPFTPTTNYGAVANATGTPIWFQSGLQASSTSNFVNLITTNSTSTNATSSNLFVGTNGSTADAWTTFGASGYEWSIGFNSSNKDFQISSSTSLGTFNVLDITKAGVLTFTYGSSTAFTVSGTASTTNLVVSSAGGAAGCATFAADGTISNTGTACGTGGSGSYPFTPSVHANTSMPVSATSSIIESTSGLVVASTTNPIDNLGGTVNQNGQWPLLVSNPTSATGSSTGIGFQISSLPAGPNAFGAIGGGIGFVRQGAGSFGDLFFATAPSGGANTERARITSTGTVGIGTTTPFAKFAISLNSTDSAYPNNNGFVIASSTSAATTTLFSVSNIGSTTIGRLGACSGSNALTTDSSGVITCGAITGGAGVFPFTPTTNYGAAANSTSTAIWFQSGLQASSTSRIASTTFSINGNIGINNSAPTAMLQIKSNADPINVITGGFSEANTASFYPLVLQNPNSITSSSTGIGFSVTSSADTPGAAIVFQRTASNQVGNFLFITAESGGTLVERMRIQDGLVGVASTSPFARLSVMVNAFDTNKTTTAFAIGSTTASATSTLFLVKNTGQIFMPLLTQSGANQTYYACGVATTFELVWDTTTCLVSAARFKTNVANLDLGLDALMKVRPVVFNYKPTGNPAYDNDINIKHQQVGVIADEVAKIDTRLVTYNKDGQIQGFNYEQYTAWLTKAVQELNNKVDTIHDVGRSAEENWQWFAIGLLALSNLYLIFKRKNEK